MFAHLYESFAHLMIPRGGDFRTRHLTTGKSSVFHLEPKVTKPLNNVHDLSKVNEKEYRMGHNTFPALDAITTDPPSLFNMTVTHKPQRGLNENALRSALDNIPTKNFPRPCRYNWVVPSNLYNDFQKQSVNGIRTNELETMLEQFVMELTISEPMPMHRIEVVNSDGGNKRTVQDAQTEGPSVIEEAEKEEPQQDSGRRVCGTILKSGPKKGKKCGRVNCSFHSLSKDTNDQEHPKKRPKR